MYSVNSQCMQTTHSQIKKTATLQHNIREHNYYNTDGINL